MVHVSVGEFSMLPAFAVSLANTLGFAGSLDRYDSNAAYGRVVIITDHGTAVPIIFSGIFGVG